MRVLLVLAGIAVVATLLVAPSADARVRADATVFDGLGTWVDIYDKGVYRAPEATAKRIADRGVRTVFVETANYNAPVDIVQPTALGRLVDGLHARGVNVVAWYLAGYVKPQLDTRRTLAMLSFRTPTEGAFDGVALDVEATDVKNVAKRNVRLLTLAGRLRQEAGSLPVGMIPFNPRGLERHPAAWPNFPWAQLAQLCDAFAPMVYTGGDMRGFDATYGYVTRSLRLLRTATGVPDMKIHVVGGTADRLGPDELAGFAAAISDDGNVAGVSLYDWATTRAQAWSVLAGLT